MKKTWMSTMKSTMGRKAKRTIMGRKILAKRMLKKKQPSLNRASNPEKPSPLLGERRTQLTRSCS